MVYHLKEKNNLPGSVFAASGTSGTGSSGTSGSAKSSPCFEQDQC